MTNIPYQSTLYPIQFFRFPLLDVEELEVKMHAKLHDQGPASSASVTINEYLYVSSYARKYVDIPDFSVTYKPKNRVKNVIVSSGIGDRIST